MSIREALYKSAANYPEKTAVYCGEEEMTYRQLADQVNRLANGLGKLGLKKGDRAAVMLSNCPEFVVAYFGIISTGAAIVPINPLFKGEELKYILNDGNIKILITAVPFQPLAESIQSEVESLESLIITGGQTGKNVYAFQELIANSSAEPLKIAIDPGDIASCLYTSGTTGKPKGALLSHDNLLFDAEATLQHLNIGSAENYLCVLPLFHSFAETVCMLIPIYSGASLTILDKFRPDLVFKEIENKRITLFAGVPAMYGAFLSAVKEPKTYDLSSLKLCFSGGAPLPVEIMKFFEERYGVTMIEGNGPTETSPVSYANPTQGIRKPGSVGIPIPGVQVKIVDKNDAEVPVDEIGEICVKGRNVMQGYLNRPEETQEVLKGGWFHTGDLGKKDEDGYVYIVDRKKDMLIVGGLNVYPREVEEVLYRHPAVLEAAVIGISNDLRGEVPKAFIVLKPDSKVDKKELTAHCRKNLANYKCPKQFEFCATIPKTVTGKIDKKLLREGKSIGL
ncbi:MAG: long-chain-fatty-acid--CoA ligase [Peptococcaceae bacterium]